jgi:hypothetical protein
MSSIVFAIKNNTSRTFLHMFLRALLTSPFFGYRPILTIAHETISHWHDSSFYRVMLIT